MISLNWIHYLNSYIVLPLTNFPVLHVPQPKEPNKAMRISKRKFSKMSSARDEIIEKEQNYTDILTVIAEVIIKPQN